MTNRMLFTEETIQKNHHRFIDVSEPEIEQPFISIEIIEYVPNSVVIKTILKKSTGNISVMSNDNGEGLVEKKSAFDTFVQVIDGRIELMIGDELHSLAVGQSIVIPAHSANHIRPNGRFKILMTVIKNGYQ